MQDHEMIALLGPAYDETTAEQRQAIDRAAAQIGARYPDPDLEDTRQQAMTGALEVVLGDATDTEVVAAWRAARAAERDAHARMAGALIVAARTESEASLSGRLGINRMTLRKALGK